MESKKIILGLDVSTTTIGICLMLHDDKEDKILKLTHIAPKISSKVKGLEALFLKNEIFENEFLEKYKDTGITDVIIEEPLLKSNNVYTVATLIMFNGMVCQSVYKTIGIIPKRISSHDARKFAFPELVAIRKFDKKGNPYSDKEIKTHKPVLFGGYAWDIDKKQVILDKVSEKYPDIDWIYNAKGELKKENFDSSDAVCCVLGYIGMEKEMATE